MCSESDPQLNVPWHGYLQGFSQLSFRFFQSYRQIQRPRLNWVSLEYSSEIDEIEESWDIRIEGTCWCYLLHSSAPAYTLLNTIPGGRRERLVFTKISHKSFRECFLKIFSYFTWAFFETFYQISRTFSRISTKIWIFAKIVKLIFIKFSYIFFLLKKKF